ncbi:MAG: hypothetical protein CMC47_02860 [Flavobacteriaceae bacterium]|nr:hypothetical protein [Flavobacteriaceae bacterium]
MRIGIKKIIALLLIPQVLILSYFKNNPRIVEEYYSEFIYQYIFKFYSMLFSGFSIAIGDLLVLLALISSIIYFIFFFRFKINDFINVFAVISITIFLFYSLWGLNYFKTPLLSKFDIGEIKYESLQTTLDRLIDDANEAHLILGDEDSTLENLEFDKEKIISELKLDNIKKFDKISTTKFAKKSIIPKIFLYQGVSGYINPFTLEAIVVEEIPSIDFSITVLHEQAHQLGYAAEEDANFLAFISSVNNQDPLIKYSGYVFGLSYLLNEIQINHNDDLSSFTDKINSGIIEDINSRRKFWQKYSNNIINSLQNVLYDFYLKSNNQKAGIASYSRIVNHIINYYENDRSLSNY